MYTRDFIHEFREAVRDADIPPAYKLLLFTLSLYAKSDGGNVRPSQTALAKACSCSEKTVSRHASHLQEAGWLLVTERGHSGEGRGGLRRANVYQLTIGQDFAFAHGAVRLAPKAAIPAAPIDRATEPAKVVPQVQREVEPEAAFEPSFEGFGSGLSVDDIVDF